MNFADPKLVEVYRARTLPEAYAIRNALEEAGFRVQVEGELLQGVVGEIPAWPSAPRILVEESQVIPARLMIDRLALRGIAESGEEEQGEEIRCLACGRRMAEEDMQCPACGWSYQGEEKN